MTTPEILLTGVLLIGYPSAEGGVEVSISIPDHTITEVNEKAVLPKVLRIESPDIDWVEQ